jgi:hypothetical protein
MTRGSRLFRVPVVALHLVHQNWYRISFTHTDLSWEYLGQVRFWVRSSHFGQSCGPWISKNCNNLQFPFIFFALDAHIEMKFNTQIYHGNI